MTLKNMEIEKIRSVLESLLLVSGDPLDISKLAKIIEVSVEKIQEGIVSLKDSYLKNQSGLELVQSGNQIQLVSNANNAQFVEKMMKIELEGSLSNSSLEVVSIIAYRGPISKPEIEAIRGVNCSYALRNLSMRGLIERQSNPQDSRGYLYKISLDFLKKMGIDQVEKLPKYDILSKDERVGDVK